MKDKHLTAFQRRNRQQDLNNELLNLVTNFHDDEEDKEDKLKRIDSLLNMGAQTTAKHEFGTDYTVSHFAVERGLKEVLELFVKHGTDLSQIKSSGVVNFSEVGSTYYVQNLMHTAARSKNPDMVSFLSKYMKCEIDSYRGISPLHIAASNQDEETVRSLLRAGCTTNISPLVDLSIVDNTIYKEFNRNFQDFSSKE